MKIKYLKKFIESNDEIIQSKNVDISKSRELFNKHNIKIKNSLISVNDIVV